MSGEQVLVAQKKMVEDQEQAHGELQRYLMNSDCTLWSRVEHPINEIQGITTLVPPEEEDDVMEER